MPVAPLPNLDMYYELHGPDDAPPLVLLHGATETFQLGWKKQVPAFSEHYRILGPDLRGHGRSTNPAGRLDLREMADDIGDLLNYLGYRKVHMVGFSGGASVALFFAVRHVDHLWSLALVSNNMDPDETRIEQNFENLERFRQQEPEWWAAMSEMHELPVENLLQWWADESPVRPNFTPVELAHVQVPALILGGDRDPMIPLSQTLKLFDALPDAYLGILPGMGHGAPRRRPQAFNRIILDFLTYVENQYDPAKFRKRSRNDDLE